MAPASTSARLRPGPRAGRSCPVHPGTPRRALALLMLALCASASAAADPHWGDEDLRAEASSEAGQAASRARAVASPNLQVGVAYDYAAVGSTNTSFTDTNGTQTLHLDGVDGHSVSGQLVGTVPIWSVLAARAMVRGGSLEGRRSLDALTSGSSTVDVYGALGELFVRHPRIGAFAVGGGYDRQAGSHGVGADQVTGSADARIFFPDLGHGPLDWFARFEFRHREISGSGQAFNVDADVYHVTGGSRWYLSPDFAVLATGTWQRSEEEFFAEDDRTGSFGFQWRLPLPARPISVELFASGMAGLSEYKEPPFHADDRLIYGGRAGVNFRLFSGRTLVESIRQYD